MTPKSKALENKKKGVAGKIPTDMPKWARSRWEILRQSKRERESASKAYREHKWSWKPETGTQYHDTRLAHKYGKEKIPYKE